MRGKRAIGDGCASKEGGAAGVVAVAAAAAARYLFVDEDGFRIFLRQLLQRPSRGDMLLASPKTNSKLSSIPKSCLDQLQRTGTDT